VADTLLTFIQALMNEDYQLVSSYVSSSVDQPIAWELLPLIFVSYTINTALDAWRSIC
jgi:hypothetical protein